MSVYLIQYTCILKFTVFRGRQNHTHTFNGPLSGTTRVSRYQKGETNLDFTEARDSEWQWHQVGHMQVCTSLQTDNHTSTPQLSFFYRPDALPVKALKAQGRQNQCIPICTSVELPVSFVVMFM